ncbi:MAG TPA: hypothetical protein VF541_06920, partial [Longimicrobium sp.]
MKTFRIYLDTSVIGGCFDAKYEIWSNALIRDFELGFFTPVVSDLLGFEIAGAPLDVRNVYTRVLNLAEQIVTNQEVRDL